MFFWLTGLAGGCAGERPIHPYRLEGFPGAPIEADLFPMRAGTRWVFEDRVDPDRARLELELVARGERLVLVGTREGEAVVRIAEVEGDHGPERRLEIVFEITVARVVAAVAEFYGVTPDEILGRQAPPAREQDTLAIPREVVVYLSRELTDASPEAIADLFAGEARPAVATVHERIRRQAWDDNDLAATLRRLRAKLGPRRRVYYPLKLEGKVGDQWRTKGSLREKGTRYTVFGYDTVEVLGKPHRALVVAADRMPVRDLYWFAAGIGWVRIRTENEGRAKRDAFLVEFDSGGAN